MACFQAIARVESLGEDRKCDVKEEPIQEHILRTVGEIPSGPHGLDLPSANMR